MHHKHIIQSLPLLASILGRKYGVEVSIGGNTACTNGSIIQLPSLPLESDETLLGLVRGYIDHESAHIRHTDFFDLKKAQLTALEKHIWNTIEDWRVENQLATIYPGCKNNFTWLIRHFFLDYQDGGAGPAFTATDSILHWLLITVRMWDVPKLAQKQQRLQTKIETQFPGLIGQLQPVMSQIKNCCSSTHDAIRYAQAIVAVLQQYVAAEQEQQPALCDNPSVTRGDSTTQHSLSGDSSQCTPQGLQELQQVISSGAGIPSGDLGEMLEKSLSRQCSQQHGKLSVAVPVEKENQSLSGEEIDHCRQATTALRTRLQGFLQSSSIVRNTSGYSGTLNPRKLYSLSTGNTKVFLRSGERQTINTAIHILLDSSGSMMGPSMELANQACFAVASALHGIKGINLGVTAFPGGKLPDNSTQQERWNTVAPILQHNQNMHRDFKVDAAGDTPLDSALLWVLQQVYPLPQPRKIILILTDGAPNDHEAAHQAIVMVKQNNIEILGIGIMDASVTSLLPGKDSTVIQSLPELAPAMFGMLQRTLMP